jgi:hypothetical protein
MPVTFGAEVAIPPQPGLPVPQAERLEHAKGVAKEYAELKAFAKDKRQGSFAFDLGMKTQGEANLQGVNAYGTTAGVAMAPGEYFLPGTAGPDVLPSFIPGILELRWYDNVIASLFPTFPTDSPVVSYVRETAWNNAAAATGDQHQPHN